MARQMEGLGGVLTCATTQCSYNKDEECMAPSVEIGGGDHPNCDTFTTDSVRREDHDAHVTRCQVASCAWNDLRHCDANGVTVGMHQAHADCMTFRPQS